MKFGPGEIFPDLELPDHTGRAQQLSELAAGDPLALLFSRGWWCPHDGYWYWGRPTMEDLQDMRAISHVVRRELRR